MDVSEKKLKFYKYNLIFRMQRSSSCLPTIIRASVQTKIGRNDSGHVTQAFRINGVGTTRC